MSKNNHHVVLLSHSAETADEINRQHTNFKHLPNISLATKLTATNQLTADIFTGIDVIFVATPSIATLAVVEKIKHFNLSADIGFVLCSKGLDGNNLQLFSQIFVRNFSQNDFAILSGPNFANEVAQGLPTVTTIATTNKRFFNKIAATLQNQQFSCYYSHDIITTELCGIMKNIIAIGCGIVDGIGLGENAKAALVHRGVVEIVRFAKVINGKKVAADLVNPAGFGDIFLTCGAKKSRNNSLGYEMGCGKAFANIIKTNNKTYEGAISAQAIAKLSAKYAVELPLCNFIAKAIGGSYTADQIAKELIKVIL